MIKEEKEKRILIKNEYQQLKNEIIRDYNLSPIEAKELIKRIEEFHKKLQGGERTKDQIIKTAVKVGERAGKKLSECEMVQVKLTMKFRREEEIEKEQGIRQLKKLKIYQLADEAYEQGGLLSYEDISSILGISHSTIKRIVKEYKEEGIIVPSRGQIDDIGPGMTHKEKIIDLLLRGYKYSEIMIQTRHSEASIENYEMKFVRIAYLHREKKTQKEIRTITNYSEKLIENYIKIYEKSKKKHKKTLDNMLERFYKYCAEDEKKSWWENDKHMSK